MLSCARAGVAAAATTHSETLRRKVRTRGLVERLARIAAPLEAVRRTAQILHADTVIGRISAGIARDRDDVADAQGLIRHTLTRELAGAAPLDGPALQLTVLVGR